MVIWLAMKKNGWRVSVLALSKILFSMVLALGVCAAQAARITVTSSNDAISSSDCTLRGAVAVINNSAAIVGNGCTANGDAYGANDTIVFANNLAGGTVRFASTITISKPLTIQGPSTAATDPANRVTLKGGGTGSDFRLLDVDNANSPLTVEDLNFIGGNVTTGDAGAAIYSNGSAVTVSRCRFADNHAATWGGAIEARNANVTVAASEFLNNSGSLGGAINTNGSVTVSASTFSGNEVVVGSGGAIWAGTATVSASTFSGNKANGDGGGGAIQARTATVANSTFSDNSAGNWGGAILATTAIVSNSTFSGNSAGDRGGAILANSLTGRHLTLVNNTAPSGAAVYAHTSANLANSLIAGSNTNAQCAGDPSATFPGAYNLVANMPGSVLTDDTSCGNTHPILIASVSPPITTIDQIVETTLADHGGPTETLKLAVNSPAIATADQTTGAGATSQMLDMSFSPPEWVDAAVDQRGVARKAVNNGRDLGAYEVNDLTTLTPDTLPDGTVDTTYLTTPLSSGGGGGSYTYNVSSGALPPGLTLTTGGEISGTPTAAGTYTFAVTVADNGTTPPLLTGRGYTIIVGAKATATSIPLLGPWPLLLLAGMLGAIGWRGRKQWAGDR